MKVCHRPDIYCWSRLDEARDIDFHGYAWARPEGTVVFDPMPQSDHDRAHLLALGPVQWVVLTNSDHVRDAADLIEATGAKVAGPAKERDGFPIACDRWLSAGDELVPGLVTLELDGSKTPGELAFLLEGTTLVAGDLIRAHAGGRLDLLPDAKLSDPAAARASARQVLDHPDIDAVLVGDGWPVFSGGAAALRALLDPTGSR